MVYYDHKPSKIEVVGDGRYRYRWNIQQIVPEAKEEEEQPEAPPQWGCDEVIVSVLNSNVITEAVIVSQMSASREQKLVNDYNSAQLGMYGAKSSEVAKAKIAAYTNYLNRRNALKQQIDTDCEELGIK